LFIYFANVVDFAGVTLYHFLETVVLEGKRFFVHLVMPAETQLIFNSITYSI